MQEWLNWPAWKASKPQKGFRGSNPLLSAKKQRKRLQTPVNHEFTGIFILAKMQKKASKSRLLVAYSVYFFPGRKSTPNCSQQIGLHLFAAVFLLT